MEAGAIVRAEITEAPIDVGGVLADVAHDAHGAAILFLGVVRDHNEGRPVDGIHYEAYRDMAEAELRRIARDCLLGDAPAARDDAGAAAADADGAAADPDAAAPPTADVAHVLGARVSLVHRTGDLAVGDVSLAVAVSTAHRADAYALSRAILEALKQRLPVWKKERYADGDTAWLEGSTPEPAA